MDIKFYLILVILIISSIYDILYREVSNLASLFILIISLYRVNIYNIPAILIVPLPLIISNIIKKDSFGGADIKILGTLALYTGFFYGYIILFITLTIETILKIIFKTNSQPMIPYITLSYIIIYLIIGN